MMFPIPYAAGVHASLERLSELGIDPQEAVYAKLFDRHPTLEAHFWRDADGSIRGEMLSRTVIALLDFIGPRRYAQYMIGAEMVTHEGYDIPREIFTEFFGVLRDAVRELLDQDWTAANERDWEAMLADIRNFAAATPRTDVSSPLFKAKLAQFEAPFARER